MSLPAITGHACERYFEHVQGRDPATITQHDYAAIRALIRGQWSRRRFVPVADVAKHYRLGDCIAVVKGCTVVTITTQRRLRERVKNRKRGKR